MPGWPASSTAAPSTQAFGDAASAGTSGNDPSADDHKHGMPSLGTGAANACAGNDSRLSDARTPTAHAASHKSAGTDSIKLDELAAPTDITTLDASTSQHGLFPKLAAGSVLATALMPPLSGDISNSAGSLVTAIGAAKVVMAMLANIASGTVIGRTAAGSGVPSAITPGFGITSSLAISLTTATAQITSNVGLTPVNAFVDGPSVSLVAGTWIMFGVVLLKQATNVAVHTVKLWDGTTPVAATEVYHPSPTTNLPAVVGWIVAPTSTTTYKVSVATTNATTGTMLATPANNATGLTNMASSLVAVRII